MTTPRCPASRRTRSSHLPLRLFLELLLDLEQVTSGRPLLRHRSRAVHGEDACNSIHVSGRSLEARRSEAWFVAAKRFGPRVFLRGSRRGFCAGIASRRGSFESGPRYFVGSLGQGGVRASFRPIRASFRPIRASVRPIRATFRPIRASVRPIRASFRLVRAPAGGVRAPAGGVRAPAGGVRAPVGGVRALVGGVRAPAVPVARGPPAQGWRGGAGCP